MAREPWLDKLEQGQGEASWDLLIEKYHRIIAATVRHYGEGYDEVMDMFAYVCESLRANDFARLRKYAAIPEGRVRFSTWLVAVVRNLVMDWFRHRDGRKRLDKVVTDLPPVQREAFQTVFIDGHSPAAAYEVMRTSSGHDFTFAEFLRALLEAERTVSAKRPGQLLTELGPGPRRAHLHAEPEAPSRSGPAESALLGSEMRGWLREALEALPVEDRVAVYMYIIEGLPAAEVARLLGWKSAKTVYNHVYRSLFALRDLLQDRDVEPPDPA